MLQCWGLMVVGGEGEWSAALGWVIGGGRWIVMVASIGVSHVILGGVGIWVGSGWSVDVEGCAFCRCVVAACGGGSAGNCCCVSACVR